MLATLFLSVFVAFPQPSARLPHIDKSYIIGSVSRGVTNLTVQGKSVDLYRTGGWVSMLDLSPGTNNIEIIENGNITNISFFVAFKENSTKENETRIYEKLPYALDQEKATYNRLIYIDPGHGGEDTGSVSPHNFYEKDANLRVAREVKHSLEELGFTVKMTRENDRAIPLLERARAAHEEKADAFISIHHNAPNYTVNPLEKRYHCVYSWNDLGEGLAREINASMAKALDGDIDNGGFRRANYAVTRSPEISSCLIEVDFLTTPEGEEAVWLPSRRKAIGKAIACGVKNWLDSKEAK